EDLILDFCDKSHDNRSSQSFNDCSGEVRRDGARRLQVLKRKRYSGCLLSSHPNGKDEGLREVGQEEDRLVAILVKPDTLHGHLDQTYHSPEYAGQNRLQVKRSVVLTEGLIPFYF